MKTLNINDIEPISVLGTLMWKPVRKPLGVTAFGINAYTAANAGDEVVEEHTEQYAGHEEIYFVHTGHAVFTIDGEEVDAPAGTIVFIDDVNHLRQAIAKEAGTTVLAIGGVPGLHEISPWEYFFPAKPYLAAGDYDTALQILEEALTECDTPPIHYQLAITRALRGEREQAFQHLELALAGGEHLREHAKTNEQLASLRDDPRFPA